MFNWLSMAIGRRLAIFLNKPRRRYERFAVADEHALRSVLKPGDVLLVEGDRRISTAIKYITQSTWSHASLYVGDALQKGEMAGEPVLIEADIVEGVIAVPLSKYASLNTRICRPVGLAAADTERLIAFAIAQLGHAYDLKNFLDLTRFLLPVPPVPASFRRKLLAFGSGDPTRAICSTLLAQAFQQIDYPILPRRTVRQTDGEQQELLSEEEILYARHYSHFTPRDFDLSPYFAVIKPTLEAGFDYRRLRLTKEQLPPLAGVDGD